MSTTQDALGMAMLFERVKEDPFAIAQLVLEQVVARLTSEGYFDGLEGMSSEAALATALGDRLTRLITGDPEPHAEWGVDEGIFEYDELLERNRTLASAVGACDCWGDDADCRICAGDGHAGWVPPDPELFARYVDPAAQSMQGAAATSGVRDRAAEQTEGAGDDQHVDRVGL